MTDQSRRPEQFAEGLSKSEASKRIDALKAGLSDRHVPQARCRTTWRLCGAARCSTR
ncbi:hypothetical protein BH10PSE8_BH10PSE8_04580 [soil metagenome]